MNSHPYRRALAHAPLVVRTGKVRKILPTYIEADGPHAPRGAICTIQSIPVGEAKPQPITAQVISVSESGVVLAPFDDAATTFCGARVEAGANRDLAPVGDGFCGRVVDALAKPIDGGPPIEPDGYRGLAVEAPMPLARLSVSRTLETGVRAIDSLLTLGLGQRVGIFAPSGVGKTSLVTQLANQTACDRLVLCLVGERGREVEALWSGGLTAATKQRATVVAATSDQTAMMRVRAVDYALALCDHWRQQGLHVLLLLDSVTRYAMALREIGLAAGEPPTVRAYTPSVFAAIPKVVERCGALKASGSISAVMTVLSETEDNDDPICELMKSLLDGHIVLSRRLADQGHFPAIDVSRSLSRLADSLVDEDHRRDARRAVEMLSTYDASKMLIETGVYAPGSNEAIDRAVALRPGLLGVLRQTRTERVDFSTGKAALAQAVRESA